jgi:uncharacterized protein YecA (UPF0149 family)
MKKIDANPLQHIEIALIHKEMFSMNIHQHVPSFIMGAPQAQQAPEATTTKTIRNTQVKVGRNDPCPCGSGKKYKKCHGANEFAEK